MNHPRFLTLAIVVSACCLLGCGSSLDSEKGPKPKSDQLIIYTVNYPLKYFAERIGGDHVSVVFPAPEGEDPAYWNPAAADVSAYQHADLVLLNGAGYAKWLSKVSLPPSVLVDTSASISDRYIVVEQAVVHRHGSGEAHSHHGRAFTTWLDPTIAMAQASEIHRALVDRSPQLESTFDSNLDLLRSDLDKIDKGLEAAFSSESGDQPVVFSHPVFQYLQRRYSINAESLHWEPDEPPSSKDWAQFEDLLETHPARWVIWEETPLEETVKRLAARGVSSAVFAPCGNQPREGDWLTTMNRNVESMRFVYAAEPPAAISSMPD